MDEAEYQAFTAAKEGLRDVRQERDALVRTLNTTCSQRDKLQTKLATTEQEVLNAHAREERLAKTIQVYQNKELAWEDAKADLTRALKTVEEQRDAYCCTATRLVRDLTKQAEHVARLQSKCDKQAADIARLLRAVAASDDKRRTVETHRDWLGSAPSPVASGVGGSASVEAAKNSLLVESRLSRLERAVFVPKGCA